MDIIQRFSFSAYCKHFAQRRLKYDDDFNRLVKIVPKERVIVVSQERMAKNIDLVAKFIKGMETCASLRNDLNEKSGKNEHKGYADKKTVDINSSIIQELERVQVRLYDAIEKSGVLSFLI